MFKNKTFPYDIYERHKKVGELIGKVKTVLDVGGQLKLLSFFCNAEKITVANVPGSQEQSDVIIKGNKLPFAANSFQIVCAIDVLEHIPPNDRKAFIKDLLRVAVEKVIISFPIGTSQHIEYEKKLQKDLEKNGADVTYLKEHIKYGLPNLDEVKNITKGLRSKKFFSGNINVNKVLFKLFVFDPKIKYIRKALYLSKLAFNFVSNPIFFEFLSNKKYSQTVNRIYLVIEKTNENRFL